MCEGEGLGEQAGSAYVDPPRGVCGLWPVISHLEHWRAEAKQNSGALQHGQCRLTGNTCIARQTVTTYCMRSESAVMPGSI